MISSFEKCPDNWSMLRIEEIAIIQSGTGFPTDAQGLTNGTIPFLKVSDMNLPKNTRFIEEWNNSITEEQASKLKAKIFPPGAVIFPKIGGAIATNKKRVLTIPSCFDNNVMGLKAKQEVLDEYLYWLLQSIDLVAWSSSSSLPSMKASTVKEFLVPVPSMAQQKRIVEKLDALLTRIDTAIEYLQESVTLKSSLLQSALDGQFSVITNRMTIESLAEVKGGKRLPKGEKLSDEETEHPYIRVADFTDKGTIDLSGIKYISKEIHEQIKRYVISKDDLYISIAGTIGKTGFVPPDLDGANLTENAAKLVIKDKNQLDLSYLYLFTLTSDFSAQAGLATKTVAQPKLALTRLSKIEIPICSLEEQKALVSRIEALKGKIHDAENVLLGKIEDLRGLKASILDSAFKGEL